MTISPGVTVVVPTVGGSPVLDDCLAALAASTGVETQILVVADAAMDDTTIPRQSIDRIVIAPANSGFAASCNLGLAALETPYAAIVNDDAVVDPDWLASLVAALEEYPQAAAAQGINRQLRSPDRIDGCGISWNRRWQPIQIDHDGHQPSMDRVTEIFGVSATAALYRSSALTEAAIGPSAVFDPELHTYYDDVDLASRLGSARRVSLFVPAAAALHAGGASTDSALTWRYRQLYGNRILVLARLLGKSFWLRLPFILRPDLTDLVRAIGDRNGHLVRGILQGWRRAASRLSHFTHSGPPLVPIDRLERLPAATESDADVS